VLILLALIILILFGLPWGLVALVAAVCLEVFEYFAWRRFLRRYRLRSGPETMVGQTATVIDALDPEGRVRLYGEIWRARSSEPVPEGAPVRITAVHGLTLDVERGD
jgi:membrane-bound serine protease (ClpP class)